MEARPQVVRRQWSLRWSALPSRENPPIRKHTPDASKLAIVAGDFRQRQKCRNLTRSPGDTGDLGAWTSGSQQPRMGAHAGSTPAASSIAWRFKWRNRPHPRRNGEPESVAKWESPSAFRERRRKRKVSDGAPEPVRFRPLLRILARTGWYFL